MRAEVEDEKKKDRLVGGGGRREEEERRTEAEAEVSPPVSGIVVPEPLWQYMPERYRHFIPFVRPLRLSEEEEVHSQSVGRSVNSGTTTANDMITMTASKKMEGLTSGTNDVLTGYPSLLSLFIK